MIAIDRFLLLVRELRRSETGLAVPTALMALIATFGLASVAVFSTVNVQQGTARDHDSKEAIAAADAGASIAMMRLNRYLPSLSTTTPCIGPTGATQIPANGWCPKSSPPEKVGNAEFTYQVSAFGATKQIEVIAWGTSGGVTRRVNVGLQAIDGKNIFADEKVIGEDGIEFSGASAEVYTSLGTNGEIINSGNSSPTLCGNGRHGIGKGKVPPLSCGGVETEAEMTLPPVIPPSNVGADNCRLLAVVTSPCTSIDTYVAEKNNAKRSATIPWNMSPKILQVGNNANLTLSGRNYLICQLIVDGGKLYMPFNTEVNIYIDTPQNCGLAPGAVQLSVGNNGEILSSAYNPPQGSYAIPNFYLLGDGKVSLQGNPSNIDPKNGIVSNEMMIYGPQATVEFSGNSSWKGMVAAKQIYINGNVKIESSSKFKLPDKNLAPLFQRTRYVECTAAAGTSPNANC